METLYREILRLQMVYNDFFSNIEPQLADKIPTSSKHFLDFMPLPVAENFVFANITPEIVLKGRVHVF